MIVDYYGWKPITMNDICKEKINEYIRKFINDLITFPNEEEIKELITKWKKELK